MMEKKYFTLTYGCQMNESDTERINGQLEDMRRQRRWKRQISSS